MKILAQRSRRGGAVWGVFLSLLLVTGTAVAKPPTAPDPHQPPPGADPLRTPSPVTVDRIIHNQGNVATTLYNFGYINGSESLGLPSGEYPRNSGHYYLAEILYWMGAVTADGDTLVANTYDDFQGLPELSLADNPYKILLSTDTNRYYDYDPGDMVGEDLGNPANGWRVWNDSLSAWVYAKNYDPANDTLVEAGPLSLQDSHYRFTDDALGSSLLGLEMTHTVLQWNYCYNEDFLFVILEITNKSGQDYTDFAFGLYCDIDVGGLDGTGENGRLADTVAFDSSENLAWIADAEGWDPGWRASTGIMGTKYLETPQDIGMTGFFTNDWALLPDNDPGRYAVINDTSYLTSLPPTDQFYVQSTRGINLQDGETIRVVYALIAGDDEEDFRANAAAAQTLYDNYFVGPQPPTTPTLSVTPGNNRVYLHWDAVAETSVDPLTGEQDFTGYKLYRSDNQGLTWGEPIYNTGNNCLTLDYETIADYSVATPGDPIPHSLVDTGLYNGVEYWYCLVAYDRADVDAGVDALQTGFGEPTQSPNVVSVTPRNHPAGWYDAAETVQHIYTGSGERSDGQVFPLVFDESALTNSTYQVTFSEDLFATYWHLVNVTSGDTLLGDQTIQNAEEGLYEITEGVRTVVTNGDRVPRSVSQTGFGSADTTLVLRAFYGPSVVDVTSNPAYVWGDKPFRDSYELRYTGDSTIAFADDDYWYPAGIFRVPFECWNTTDNQRVSLAVEDVNANGSWESNEPLTIVNYPYDSTQYLTAVAFPYYYGFKFDLDASVYAPVVGDVLTISGAPLNGPNDTFEFTTGGVDAAVARNSLDDIRVVPDPYFVQYSAMVETAEGQSVLEFQNVPDRCTIRIYTLAGDLVNTIEHTDGSGVARWNLLSSNRQQVASGIYIYHVESPYGDHMGRFAVVK
ncbi:hypothetical protein GF420_05770 [candidate division GN15 bacterium]|nr:hypothetical protein [candidate division GN15 bacterium]